MTCEHLRTRFQFGRALGSYQALRHGAAQLWTDLTGARAVARYAAACVAAGDPDAELAAHLAEAVCAEAALHTTESCLQMMGGIGFTWEHPTHLLLKRAAAGLRLLGTPEAHRWPSADCAVSPRPEVPFHCKQRSESWRQPMKHFDQSLVPGDRWRHGWPV